MTTDNTNSWYKTLNIQYNFAWKFGLARVIFMKDKPKKAPFRLFFQFCTLLWVSWANMGPFYYAYGTILCLLSNFRATLRVVKFMLGSATWNYLWHVTNKVTHDMSRLRIQRWRNKQNILYLTQWMDSLFTNDERSSDF